jgi:glycosyltransferase involved in cell wall biosynthesis
MDGLEKEILTAASGELNLATSSIGIGLPVYNAERYVAGAIESHLSQSFGDFELIISDNGSTDATQEICRSYAARDARIRYFREEANRGLSWNHARAFELCSGEYFRWGAADDVPSPDLLDELHRQMSAEPRIVLCVPHTRNIDAAGTVVGELPRTLDLPTDDVVERAHAVLTRGYQMVFPQGLMRRSSMLSTSRRWHYFGWDFILLFELALRGRLAQTDTGHLLRRLHDRQASRVQRDGRQGTREVEPSFRTRFLLPHWRWESERLRAVARAPISLADKLKVGLLVARHAWWSRDALLGDMSKSLRLATGKSHELPL